MDTASLTDELLAERIAFASRQVTFHENCDSFNAVDRKAETAWRAELRTLTWEQQRRAANKLTSIIGQAAQPAE